MIVVIILILVIDRVTKIAAELLLPLHGSVPVIKGAFHFTLVHNTGAAFGLFKNLVVYLAVASLCVLFLLWFSLVKAHRTPQLASYRLPLSLVFAGALGNLIDRVLFGHVIDFLDFRIWPVFNIADSAITIGAILLGISMLRDSKNNT
jgi:signal peptidase II